MSASGGGWCLVQPQNVGLLLGFTALLLAVVVASLASGVTVARRSIRRELEPGAFALAGLALCPHTAPARCAKLAPTL